MFLLPGIIKTKVFALIFYVIWTSLGSLIIGINMCIWRNRTINAPIYADIGVHLLTTVELLANMDVPVTRIIHVYSITLYLSVFCFGKFTWNITRPAASRKVIDKRLRDNYIDAFLCIGVPLLWSPLLIATSRARYMIIEDLGPFPFGQLSIDTLLTSSIPLGLTAMASIYFSVLTAINIWRARRSGSLDVTGLQFPEQAPYRTFSTIHSLKYVALVVIHTIALPFGFLWTLLPYITLRNEWMDDQGRRWYMIFDIRDNLRQLPLTYTFHREQIIGLGTLVAFLISIPVNGILFFILFGLDSGALSTYRAWLQSLGLKISDMIFSIRTYATKIPWPSRESSPSTGPGTVTPFQLEDIALASYTPPVQTTTKGHVADGESDPLPIALPPPSPYQDHSNMDRLSPVPPLERARTLRKEQMLGGPSPRPPNYRGPRGAPSSPGNRRDETISHNNLKADYPPLYEPPEGWAPSRQKSAFFSNN
ncbi:a-factor receptor [Serendipita sp. 407]|nr:a-factor receptor [Serendipita sp. 407]